MMPRMSNHIIELSTANQPRTTVWPNLPPMYIRLTMNPKYIAAIADIPPTQKIKMWSQCGHCSSLVAAMSSMPIVTRNEAQDHAGSCHKVCLSPGAKSSGRSGVQFIYLRITNV